MCEEKLEQGGSVTAVAFDKPGTITQGRPDLTDVVSLAAGLTDDDVLRLAAHAEAGSEHPLAAPILDAAQRAGIVTADVDPDRFTQHAGAGVETVVDGERIAVGTPRLAATLGIDVPAEAGELLERLRLGGRTAMLGMRAAAVVGVIALADQVRPDAAAAVERLRSIGLEQVLMLTGDSQLVGDAIAGTVEIGRAHV